MGRRNRSPEEQERRAYTLPAESLTLLQDEQAVYVRTNTITVWHSFLKMSNSDTCYYKNVLI